MRYGGLLAGFGGLLGASGVAISALAAHTGGDTRLLLAAQFALIHAAALPGFVALGSGPVPRRGFLLAGLVLAVGASLFSGDLVMRALAGDKLFAMAAPIGGTLMILGWLVAALAGVLMAREYVRVD